MNQQLLVYITIANTLIVITLSIVVYTIYRTKRRIYTMAGNWGAYMAEGSHKVRREKQYDKNKVSGQSKIVDMIASEIPGAAGVLKRAGVTDQEAWALATDPDTLRGIKVIFDTFKGAAAFAGKLADKTKTARRPPPGQVPLITLQEQT